MTSVMENLIHNAQDATADDGTVTVSLHCQGDGVELLIEDNGCGMDTDFVRERLFRPFDTTKGDTGMGIGAYECKEYVNSLGGEIQIESEPGSGTRVHVILPLQGREQSVNSDDKRVELVS
jgi:signal transduction histidine kinase